jgi:flagellin-specific chaperone FliS
MRVRRFRFRQSNLVLITAAFFAMAAVSLAAQPPAAKTTAKEVDEKVAEAAEAIKSYSVDQRDEALKKAQAILNDLDARIDRMEFQLNEKWDGMNQSARNNATATLKALRKQRNKVAEWYGGLKHSSGNAWEDVKKGFLSSYRELRDAFDKAKGEF